VAVLFLVARLAATSPPQGEVDVDVDSDNTSASGAPDRDAYEDLIEDIAGDPAHPGKFVMVNDNDDDGDGIPDFADGFNWDDEDGNDDDVNWAEGQFVPLVLDIPGQFDASAAKVYFTHAASSPCNVYLSGNPAAYYPEGTWPALRLWAAPPGAPRNPLAVSHPSGGDYVYPTWFYASDLGLSPANPTITLYIEAVRPSALLADEAIEVWFDPDGTHGDNYCDWPGHDLVRVTCVRIDLDVDSDNTNGTALPPRTDYEDQIEDATTKPELPGKIIQVNDADDDGDGVPDFADGFNRDGTGGNDDDATAGKAFTPVLLEIPHPLWDIPNVAQDGTVTFTYAASDPAAVSHDPESGAYTPAPGKLRLWRKNGSEPRDHASAAAGNPGDFIPSGTCLKLSALGLASGTRVVTLYAEGIDHTATPEPERIAVSFDPDGPTGPLPTLCSDAVRVRLIRMEFVIPAEYDEATGLPLPNAAPVPTSFVGVSDPRPTVTLDEISSSAVTIANGFAKVTVSGFVKDPIADNVPRGKVSEGRADIDFVTVYVDGSVYEDAVPVSGQDDGGAGFWRQHPYKGTFAPITVSMPLEEGTHIIRVETSPNAAGNTGFDEVAVTLEKREIPTDLEGHEPPPPPTPMTETRGLWHFDTYMPPPPFAPEPLPFEPDWSTSLVFHLDTPGSAPDASGHGYDGTFSGAVATVEGGRFGSALLCPGGTYDFVEVSQSSGLDLATTDFTLEAWVQRWYDMYNMPHYGPQTILGKSDGYSGYALRIEEGRLVLRLHLDYPTWTEVVVASTTCLPTDAWTHVAACRAGDRVQLFINGVPDAMGWVMLPAWGNVSQTGEPFRVGATGYMGYPNGDSLYGLLDEVRLSSTARYVPPERFTPDDSGQENHAEIRSGDGLVDVYWARGLSLSGYAETPSSPALALGAADFTLEASIYYTWNTYGYLVSGPGYSITVDYEGRVSCSLYGADPPYPYLTLSPTATLPTYCWTPLILTRSGDTVTLLIGGCPAASGTFQGALPSHPGALCFGPSYPMDYGTGYLALDEVRLTTTTTPATGIYASIYIPANPDPNVADTIYYFHGLRDATANDPAFTETGPGTLTFSGTFQGIDTAIAIDPATFLGLTPGMDSLRATVTHVYPESATIQLTAVLVETGADSCAFRAHVCQPEDQSGRYLAWAPNVPWKVGSRPGNHSPVTVRIIGLPDVLGDHVVVTFGGDEDRAEVPLERAGPWWYMKGGSIDFGLVCWDPIRLRYVFLVYAEGMCNPVVMEPNRGFLVAAYLRMKAAEGGGLIGSSGVPLVDVQFRNAAFRNTTGLRVAKWENAFEVRGGVRCVKAGFIDDDVDRFYLRVIDGKRRGAGKVTIRLGTYEGHPPLYGPGPTTYADDPTPIELAETAPRSGVFESSWLLLVSDQVDDKLDRNDLSDPVNNDPDDQLNDRTHLVSVHGMVEAEYILPNGVDYKHLADVPALREYAVIDVNCTLLKNGHTVLVGEPFRDRNNNGLYDPDETFEDIDGNGAYTEHLSEAGARERVLRDLRTMNERYAQAGVRFRATTNFKQAPGALPAGIIHLSPNPPNGDASLSADERDLFRARLNSPNPKDIEVYYIGRVARGANFPRGSAFPSDWYRNMTTPDLNDTFVLPNNATLYSVAHEAYHILSQTTPHSTNENLFASSTGIVRVGDADVTDTKRLTQAQELAIRGSEYVPQTGP